MNRTVEELRRAGSDVLQVTFVEPVRGGRPRPRSWPAGLGTVGLACAVIFVLLSLTIVGSSWLRQADRLIQSHTSGQSVPATSVPLLLVAIVLAFALAATAALHAPWWLRVSLLLLTAEAVLFFAGAQLSNLWAAVPAAGGFLALVLFTVVRSFGAPAWWEFAVVLALLLVAMFGPWLVPNEFAWGIDARLTAIEGALGTLQPLILPAVMVAACAPAQIVVTGAQAVADRPVSPGLFRAALIVAAGAFVATAAFAVAGGDATPTALLAAVVLLLSAAAVVALLTRRAAATAPPAPDQYPPVWANWLYPLAAAISILLVAIFVLGVFQSVVSLFSAGILADVLNQAWYLFTENESGVWWRGMVGAVALVLAWRFSGRGRLAEAVLLGTFAVVTLIDVVGLVPGLDLIQRRSAEFTGLLVAGAAVVIAIVLLVRKRFDRVRAVGLLTVLLLAVLYPQRQLLSDPISAALQVAPAALLIFGITWRVFTEAEVTATGSVRYPQSTRVLLFLANIMLATAGIAWVSLTRGTGTTADPSAWGFIGDAYLGEPLFYAGLIGGVWLMLRPGAAAGQAIVGAEQAPIGNAPVPLAGDIQS